MPLLGPKVSMDSCPDAETICSVIDGEASRTLIEAVAAHAARCPQCAQFEQRLRRFDRTVPFKYESEWGETEKRLDNWVEGFLASGTVVAGGAAKERAPGFIRYWKHITNPLHSVGFQFALGATTALVLVVGVFVLTRVVTRNPVETATRTTVSQERSVDFISSQKASKKNDTAPETREESVHVPLQPKQPASAAPDSRTSTGSGAPNEQVSASTVANSPVEESHAIPSAEAVTPPPSSAGIHEEPPRGQLEPPSPTGAAIALGPASPAGQGKGPVQAARSISPRPTNGGVNVTIAARGGGIAGNASSQPTGGGEITGTNSAGGPGRIRSLSQARSTTTPGQPSSQVAASSAKSGWVPPASVQLEAGTRVWITVKSVTSGVSGDFEFWGTVLLPVEHANSVLLERDTEVYGVGNKRNSRTSLRLIELIIRGKRYGLKAQTNAMNADAPGSGGAVEFSAGHVFEMWMASRAVYAPR
jgi:hypothetical protein